MSRLVLILRAAVGLARFGAAVGSVGCASESRSELVDGQVAILRHLIEEAVPAHLGDAEDGFCIGAGSLEQNDLQSPDAALVNRLRAAGMKVQPIETCALPISTPHATDLATGQRRIILVTWGVRAPSPDTLWLEAAYHAGPGAGAGWQCVATKSDLEWRVNDCCRQWDS